jgi:hypothetical protein
MEELVVKQALIEQRVDMITREFIDEIKKTNSLLEKLNARILDLENDRMKAKSFIGGIVFLGTAIGALGTYLLHLLTDVKMWN